MWIRDGWNWVRIVSSDTLNNGSAGLWVPHCFNYEAYSERKYRFAVKKIEQGFI